MCTRSGNGKLKDGDKLFFVNGKVIRWICKDGKNSIYPFPPGLYPTFENFKSSWMRNSSAMVEIYHIKQSELMEECGYVPF